MLRQGSSARAVESPDWPSRPLGRKSGGTAPTDVVAPSPPKLTRKVKHKNLTAIYVHVYGQDVSKRRRDIWVKGFHDMGFKVVDSASQADVIVADPCAEVGEVDGAVRVVPDWAVRSIQARELLSTEDFAPALPGDGDGAGGAGGSSSTDGTHDWRVIGATRSVPKRRRLGYEEQLDTPPKATPSPGDVLSPPTEAEEARGASDGGQAKQLSRFRMTQVYKQEMQRMGRSSSTPSYFSPQASPDFGDPAQAAAEQQRPPTDAWVDKHRAKFFAGGGKAKGEAFGNNRRIAALLAEMAEMYKASKDGLGKNQWRVKHYTTVERVIKNLPFEVESASDPRLAAALKRAGCGGEGILEKIGEILESGTFSKLDGARRSPQRIAMTELTSIWGVGTEKAQELVHLGVKSVAELAQKDEAFKREHLREPQRIGLELRDELRERIPREEVRLVERRFREMVQQRYPEGKCYACGSYRRGRASCGDVDILICPGDESSDRAALLRDVLEQAQREGIITHHLTRLPQRQSHSGKRASWMGIYRLAHGALGVEGDRPHRRIDVKVYSRSQYPFALLYFTGSGHFNRSMRAFVNKKGWQLSDCGLRQRFGRRGSPEETFGPYLQGLCTEQDIFKEVGLDYRDPRERDSVVEDVHGSTAEGGGASDGGSGIDSGPDSGSDSDGA